MAHIYRKTQIRDKSFGGKALTFTPKIVKSDLKRALKAYDRFKDILSKEQQKVIPKTEIIRVVTLLTHSSTSEQHEFLNHYALTIEKFESNPSRYIMLKNAIFEFYQQIQVGASEKRKKRFQSDLDLISIFFKLYQYENCSQLTYDTGTDYINWRRNYRRNSGTTRKDSQPMSNKTKPIKSDTIEEEISLLKEFNKFGYRRDYFKRWDYFEGLKLPPDEPIDEPLIALNIEEQKENLDWLRKNGYAWAHDIALFITVSGCRGQDIQALKPKNFSLKHNCLQFHDITFGDKRGYQKTTSAQRIIPLNPTLINLYKRGYIFEERKGDIANILTKYLTRKSKGKNPPPKRTRTHIYRHNFACNHLRAGEISMIELAKRMGHSKSSFTEQFYARYENRVLDLEKRKAEYKRFIIELEYDYFDKYSESIP